MRRPWLVVGVVLAGCVVAQAQIVVFDPAVTTRNGITAGLKEYLVRVQDEQRQQLTRMALRLSAWTDLDEYGVSTTPEWRVHDGAANGVLFAGDYYAALNAGDASGSAYLGVTVPVVDPQSAVDEGTSLTAWREVAAQLATIDVADATGIAAAHAAGRIRDNGQREAAAIRALEADVLDPSPDQSATAVLDKMSGAVLIGARQRQSRMELLTGVVEQLVVDSKRARDTEAAATNMQLTTWREAGAANDAFVAGSGDALRTWRQP